MSNYYLNEIINQQIYKFSLDFCHWAPKLFAHEKKPLIHTGEFGMYREEVARTFLRNVVSKKFEVNHGFILNPHEGNEGISTQCDIVIYDKISTPFFEDGSAKFFPMETVVAIGEVKSDLNKTELATALNKLAAVKKKKETLTDVTTLSRFQLDAHFEDEIKKYERVFFDKVPCQFWNQATPTFKDRIERINQLTINNEEKKQLKYYSLEIERLKKLRDRLDFNIRYFHTDHVFTFLICNKITDVPLNELPNVIADIYKSSKVKRIHRHNMILSLQDGLLIYIDPFNPKDGNHKYFPFPNKWNRKLKNIFVPVVNGSTKFELTNFIVKELEEMKIKSSKTKFDLKKADFLEKVSKYIVKEFRDIEGKPLTETDVKEIFDDLFNMRKNKITTGRHNNVKEISKSLANQLMYYLNLSQSEIDEFEHIKIFSHYLFLSTTDATIIYPELAKYLNPILHNRYTITE